MTGGMAYLFLSLLFIFNILVQKVVSLSIVLNENTHTIQRGFVPVVGIEARQRNQFFAIFAVFDSPKFQDSTV
jgi:low affinity Fe/Cu permease